MALIAPEVTEACLADRAERDEAVARADRWAEAYRKLTEERDALRSEVSEAKRWAIYYRSLWRGDGISDAKGGEEDPDWMDELR